MWPNYYDEAYGTGGNNLANFGTNFDGSAQVGASNNGPVNSNSPWLNSQNIGRMTGDVGAFLGGLFGHSGQPYQSAGDAYNRYANMGAGAMQPYQNAGTAAIPNYQHWAQSMQNPAQFQNNLMNQYQESPWAKYMQQQSMRAGMNAGNAAGLSGSTPMALQLQQNAGNISSQDMNNWLQNTLGINTQYGNAENSMMNTGLMGANSLLGLYGQEAGAQGEAAYGQALGNQQDQNNTEGGFLGILGDIIPHL